MAAHLKAPESNHPHDRTEAESPDLTTTELLELFGDEYTRRVFEAVADQPRGGRSVAAVADVSRPTAYRRLNDLRDAGLVTTEMAISKDGHHRERFEAVVDHIDISLDSGGLEAAVSLDR